jgi:hypothetical protein
LRYGSKCDDNPFGFVPSGLMQSGAGPSGGDSPDRASSVRKMDLHESARDCGRGAASHNVTLDMTRSLDQEIARVGKPDTLKTRPTIGPEPGEDP